MVDTQKEKIDYVFVLSPGTVIGGAERYVQLLARKLKKDHASSVRIAISHNRDFYRECDSTEVPALYLGDTLQTASAFFFRFLKDAEVQTIVSNGYHSSYLVFLSMLRNFFSRKRFRWIDIKHGWITTNRSERRKTFLDKITSIFQDRIVIVNPSMEKELWYVSKKRLFFLPSGVNIQATLSPRQPKSPFHVLTVGRLSEEKRFHLTLKALSCIPQEAWDLTVVGDGSEMQNLKQTAVRGSIDHKISFIGFRNDVEPFYRMADLLIISSVSEGCPLVALEAMAYGVPVLSTDIGYMPALLNRQRGFVVDKNISPEAMAEKIKEIIQLTPVRRTAMQQAAWEYVHERHNLERNAEIFKTLAERA